MIGYNRVPILLANITATYSDDDDENGVGTEEEDGTEEDGGIDLVVPVVDIGIVRFMTLVIFLIDFGWFNDTYVYIYVYIYIYGVSFSPVRVYTATGRWILHVL